MMECGKTNVALRLTELVGGELNGRSGSGPWRQLLRHLATITYACSLYYH